MVLLACPCLNIRVHSKETPQLCNVSDLSLSVNTLADSFFGLSLYDVPLDLAGVTKAQEFLCDSRCAADWVITTCSNCNRDVYAKQYNDTDRVLVNTVVEKDPSRITSLMESDLYSSLFKLVLPEISNNFVRNNVGIELMNSSLSHSMDHVKHQVSAFLKEEQKAMEERIRQFTQQQQMRFAELVQNVRNHKESMVYLVLKTQRNRKQSLSELTLESPLASPVSPVHQGSSDDSSSSDSALPRSESSELLIQAKIQVQPPNNRTLRRVISTPARTKPKSNRKLRHHTMHTFDVGGVFDMEGFDFHKEPTAVYNSDDDDETDVSDGSVSEDSLPPKPNNRQTYATSLPVSVPAFCSYPRHSSDEEEKDVSMLEDPNQIAENIQALACSVLDGTEMFGDLPRRRLNTGDLIQSRLF